MSSLLEHCHGEKTHFSSNEKRTILALTDVNDIGQRGAQDVHTSPSCAFNPIGFPPYRACEEQKGAYFG